MTDCKAINFTGAQDIKARTTNYFLAGQTASIHFYPDELENNTHMPPIVITNFQIFNKPVEINRENSVLEKIN